MRTEKFKSLFKYAPKSNLKASDGGENGNFPFYTSSSIISKRTDKAQYYDEALLFGNGGSANVHYANEPFGTTSHCFVANPISKNINVKYVYYYLFGNIHLLERGFKGAGLKNISPKYIENLDIPVLPIETQNKIVAILDKASSLVIKREESIALLDELLRVTYLDMFGDLFSNEKKWNLETIENLCDVQGGLQITPKRNSNPIEMKYLRVANVFRGFLDLNEIKKLRVTENEITRILLKPSDILLVEGHGNINEIGRAALWNGEIENMLHQNHLIRLRISSSKVNAVFLTEYLNSYSGIHQMRNISNTTSGLNTISTGKVKSIKLPVPSIELQNKFELLYKRIKEDKVLLSQSKFQLSNFFQSLLQKAFNGQLNFNVDFEWDSLIKEIDLDKKGNAEYSATDNDRTEPKPINNIITEKKSEADNKNTSFNETEGNAIFKKVFLKKANGFGFDEFETFIKTAGFTYEYQQLKDFIFNKLENKEIIQFYSNEEWRKNNYKKNADPLQDDFAGHGKIYLVPNKAKK